MKGKKKKNRTNQSAKISDKDYLQSIALKLKGRDLFPEKTEDAKRDLEEMKRSGNSHIFRDIP